MTKKDPDNQLDAVSGKNSGDETRPVDQQKDVASTENASGKTEVKNAHASGNGSIGRSEEDLSDSASTKESSGF
jgi:hypothetical protein